DNHLLDETNAFDLHVTREEDLGDLPDGFVAAAREEAKKRGHDTGWSFTLQRPSYYPFLDYSPNRELREKLFQGYANRGNNNNDQDNKKVLEEIVNLRIERSHLLGYKTHADYVLEESMAENPANVYKLLDQIWKPALKTAIKDRDLLAKTMKADGVKGDLRASDWRYYVRQIRAQKYNFDEDQTRPYFEANAVRDGAFMLAGKLFGLSFEERSDITTWHEDQQVFEVFDDQHRHVGILYNDFYARASKRGGAWMNECLGRNARTGGLPVAYLVCNQTPPVGDSPSLMYFDEVLTLFHEFGHGLQHMLTSVDVEENQLILQEAVTKPRGTGRIRSLAAETIIFAIGDKVDESFGLPTQWNEFVKNEHPRFPQDGTTYEAYDPAAQAVIADVFVAGWARKASHGLVGYARKDGINGAKAVWQYLQSLQPDAGHLSALTKKLDALGKPIVTNEAALRLYQAEADEAQKRGLDEFKYSSNKAMLKAIRL
ncbi:MAG: M3 family metallopeptidase, partial [Anaerolineales bacterium]|nr:M3 family metallopeptidase [Anaerolineales bacterium]